MKLYIVLEKPEKQWKDSFLLTLPRDNDLSITDHIRKRYPNLDITTCKITAIPCNKERTKHAIFLPLQAKQNNA